MKKTLVRKKRTEDGETLRSEYRFDYSKSQPNRFAAKMSKGTVAVVLEPDVAEIFRSSAVVNALLRSIIAAMPSSKQDPRSNRAVIKEGDLILKTREAAGLFTMQLRSCVKHESIDLSLIFHKRPHDSFSSGNYVYPPLM